MATDTHSHEHALSCSTAGELLAAWVDGALQGDEARAVTRHVAQCQACEAEVQILRELLADLHEGLEAEVPERDPAFWQSLADGVDAAIDRLPVNEPVQPPAQVIALPQRKSANSVWLAVGALAAALLAVVGLHTVAQPGPMMAGAGPTLATPESHWTDALQARMSVEDDPVAGDTDPIEDLEELDDDELEQLATQLGEEG